MRRLALAVVTGLLGLAGSAVAADAKPCCPVSGKPCAPEHSIEYMGKKLAFCCPNCPAAFKADPKKFAGKAHMQMLQTGELALIACPYSGQPLNADTAIDVGGVKIAFCCERCQGMAKKSQDTLVTALSNAGKCCTVQTMCPVSGKKIDALHMVDYKGSKVFFCCGNCPDAFNKDPEKFANKLPQLKLKEDKS